MDEDINLDLDNIQANAEEKLKVKNRFEKLSENVILTSKERDEAIAKANANAEAQASAEKERDFYKDFSVNVSKYPAASEYQEQILEKVRGGYSTEDAMISVLAKEGKLTMPSSPAPQLGQNYVEGGSAPTAIEGGKSLETMKLEEKYAALEELDKSGDLASALRGR